MVSRLLDWIRLVYAGAPQRALTPSEIAAIPAVFRHVLPLDDIRLIARAHNPFAFRKILVRPLAIYWPNTPNDLAADPRTLSLLFHELAHVWQYETVRLTALNYLLNPSNWTYRYVPGGAFGDYGIEAQADIIEDWCRMRSGLPPHRYRDDPPDPEWLDAVVPFSAPPLPLG